MKKVTYYDEMTGFPVGSKEAMQMDIKARPAKRTVVIGGTPLQRKENLRKTEEHNAMVANANAAKAKKIKKRKATEKMKKRARQASR